MPDELRLSLAIAFAERLIAMGTEQDRAIRLAAAAHDVTEGRLVTAWIGELLHRSGAANDRAAVLAASLG